MVELVQVLVLHTATVAGYLLTEHLSELVDLLRRASRGDHRLQVSTANLLWCSEAHPRNSTSVHGRTQPAGAGSHAIGQ